MKKIIFACNGNKFSRGAFEFIKQIAQSETVLVTGAFFHREDYAILIPSAFAAGPEPYSVVVEQEKESFQEGIELFKNQCSEQGIEYRVHEESKNWHVMDLVRETRFADLLVISGELFFEEIGSAQPNALMMQALHRSECPVLVVPENFTPFQKIVIAYDGEKESVYALKHFCYLFPEWADFETEIVYIKREDKESIPDLPYLEEYAGRHFKNLKFEKLHFTPKKYFTAWLEEDPGTLLVCGAYSRSLLSTAFKENFAQNTISEHKNPIFIAHTF